MPFSAIRSTGRRSGLSGGARRGKDSKVLDISNLRYFLYLNRYVE